MILDNLRQIAKWFEIFPRMNNLRESRSIRLFMNYNL